MLDKLRELYYRVMYGGLREVTIICDASTTEAAHEFRVASREYLRGRAKALQAPIKIENADDTCGTLIVVEVWHGGAYTLVKGHSYFDVETLEPVLSA